MSDVLPSEVFALLQKSKHLRAQGKIYESMGEFNKLIDYLKNGAVLAEGIKLMLLIRQAENAWKMYAVLRNYPDAARFWDVETLCRLRSLVPGREVPEIGRGDLQPARGRWVAAYRERGEDPMEHWKLSRFQLKCADGPSQFFFWGECPFCGHSFETTVHRTFIIFRKFLCPECLGRLALDSGHIKDFFTENHPQIFTPRAGAMARRSLAVQEEIGQERTGDQEIPRLCRHLNQQYMFYLNQVAISRLLAGKS